MSTASMTYGDAKRILKTRERADRVASINDMREQMRQKAVTINNDSLFMTILLNLAMITVVVTGVLAAVNYLVLPVMASGEGAFYDYIGSGAFVDDGINSGWSSILLDAVGKFMGVALPTMSILSITFVMLSLICTVLYLFKQEYFDQVHLAKAAVRDSKGSGNGGSMGGGLTAASNALRNITSNNAVSQYGFFKCYVCPNVKGIAFAEATDQPMSVVDFFKVNFFKIIIMFAFCMAISDQTMLNLFLRGAEIGKYGFDRLSKVEYAVILDGFLSTGSDYKPAFDKSSQEGKNKTKVFNALYSSLKTKMTDNAHRQTAFKQAVGRQVFEWIESQTTIPWDRKKFNASAQITQLVSMSPNSENVFHMSLGEFSFPELVNETLVLTIFSEASKDTTSVLMTTDRNAWSPTGENSVEYRPANVLSLQAGAELRVVGFSTAEVWTVDENNVISSVLLNYNSNEMANNGVTITPLTGESGNIEGYTITSEQKIHSVKLTRIGYQTRVPVPNSEIEVSWGNEQTHIGSNYLAAN